MNFNLDLGELESVTLANGWASRMQQLYDLSKDGLLNTKEQREAAITGLAGDEAFGALASDGSPEVKEAVAKIREQVPLSG